MGASVNSSLFVGKLLIVWWLRNSKHISIINFYIKILYRHMILIKRDKIYSFPISWPPCSLPGGNLSYSLFFCITQWSMRMITQMLAYIIRLFNLGTCLGNYPYWYLHTSLILGESRMVWIYRNLCYQFSTDAHLCSFSLLLI